MAAAPPIGSSTAAPISAHLLCAQSRKRHRLDPPPLSCGCPRLDALLRTSGARGLGGVLELSGEAGAGKTQLCLCLAVRTALACALGRAPPASAVMYINSEDRLPSSRLAAIAAATVTAAAAALMS